MFKFTQKIGLTLLLPLAMFPIAAALLILGAPAYFDLPLLMQIGALILQHMMLFFALGVALGIASRHRLAISIAVIIGYILVFLGGETLFTGLGLLAGMDLSSRPLLPQILLAVLFILCYGLIFLLVYFLDLRSPARKNIEEEGVSEAETFDLARGYINALGGDTNINSINSAGERMRFEVNDTTIVDSNQLSALGARGIVKQSGTAVQIIVGSRAKKIARAIAEELPGAEVLQAPITTSVEPIIAEAAHPAQPMRTSNNVSQAHDPTIAASASLMIKAFGGAHNIREAAETATTRVRVVVHDPDLVNEDALRAAGASGVMTMGDTFHILLGMRARIYGEEIQSLLAQQVA